MEVADIAPTLARNGGGAIVNVSSVAALRDVGYPYPAYMASKAAVNAFTPAMKPMKKSITP